MVNDGLDVKLEQVEGKLFRYLFHNSETGYGVAKIILYELNEKQLTIAGYFPTLEKDVLYRFYGNYKDHTKYGLQFGVEMLERVNSNDYEGMVRFFSGLLFPGIGYKTAQSIVDTLGLDAAVKIKADANCLSLVPKLSAKKVAVIIEGLNQEQDELVGFLQSYGLGIRNIMKIQQIYRDEALAIIKHNPYQMVEDIDGIGFTTADKLARKLGFSFDHPFRVRAAMMATVLQLCMASGDSYVELNVLLVKMYQEFDQDLIDSTLQELLDRRQLLIEDNRVYHYTQFDAEEYIADYIFKFSNDKQLNETDNYDDLLESVQKDLGIIYDELQKSAIVNLIKSPLMLLTGGPGTGKTTVVRGIVKLFELLYPTWSIVLCAPTGRAAKRLKELTGCDAFTVHSLLKWNLETNTFGKNLTDPLSYDFIIVDECSMIDAWLLYNLLLACGNVKKLLLIGDANQLASVGPGKILADMINSQCLPVSALQHIYRQKEGSEVIQLAHQILCQEVTFGFNEDVRFIPVRQDQVRMTITKLIKIALAKGYTIQDIQVLTCQYNGVNGIDNLNLVLQQEFNPPNKNKLEIRNGHRIFREQDKILQLKNMPDYDVYNGDIGTIIELAYDESQQPVIVVDYDGIIVEFKPEDFNKITHAYCMSVHKAQGSEYPIVIMPFTRDSMFMLDKRIVYTAVTRSSKSLILLGDDKIFLQAVATADKIVRKTTLTQRLIDIFAQNDKIRTNSKD
jgi:exodeoxyribonuclease V alpha subunit